MSELQIGILILGVAIVALVYGFNFFQEWRFRKKTSQAFSRSHDDVLLDVPKNNVRDGVKQDRMDPVLVESDFYGDDDEDEATFELEQEEPVATAPIPTSQASVPPATEVEDHNHLVNAADHQALVVAMMDPSLDFIAEVVFHAPHELLTIPHFNTGKRTQLIGRTEKGLWKPAEALPGTHYKQINISMQMVDRGGALSEEELNSFCQQVSHFAEENGAVVSFPQRQQKLVAARELDRFCEDVDVLIGINIVARHAVEGTRLRSFVEAAGFQLEPDGAFHYLADSGNTLYSLTNGDQMPFTFHTLLDKNFSALTLLFDVPRVAGGIEVFDRALQFARHFAQEFDALLVDDNRKQLTDVGLNRIREQLKQIYSNMDDRGIASGSVAALRLFA